MKTGPKPKPIHERFMSFVKKDEETGCWVWTGSMKNDGYGSLVVGSRTNGRKTVRAHRLSYQLFCGEIPEGKEICHACDNPPCVNPSHLFAGTHSENMIDMVGKGRGRKPARTLCMNGHEATPGIECRECRRATNQRFYHRNQEQERQRKRDEYWRNKEESE